MKISEVEEAIREIFKEEDGKVKSVETVYELSDDESFYRLVVSIQGLSIEDTLIIHTKFIYKADLQKVNIIDNSLIYLFDINCIYQKVEFANVVEMKQKIENIIESNDFGEDLIILSDFIEAPAMFINYYMRRAKITQYSVFNVKYEPKFKIQPCDQTTFDFEIDVNNSYTIYLSISKVDKKDKDDTNKYKMQFKFLDDVETVTNDTLQNIHYFIGSNIAKMLDAKLK